MLNIVLSLLALSLAVAFAITLGIWLEMKTWVH